MASRAPGEWQLAPAGDQRVRSQGHPLAASGASPPPTAIVLLNRGRKSGRLYRTPVSILVEDRKRSEVVVGPMWSKNTDWYLNVVSGGLVEARVRGEAWQVEWCELDEPERRAAGEAFRDAHPIYSRIILRTLVRLNGLEGDDPGEAAVRALPMLSLRRVGP